MTTTTFQFDPDIAPPAGATTVDECRWVGRR
jgi:hypothetical protein